MKRIDNANQRLNSMSGEGKAMLSASGEGKAMLCASDEGKAMPIHMPVISVLTAHLVGYAWAGRYDT